MTSSTTGRCLTLAMACGAPLEARGHDGAPGGPARSAAAVGSRDLAFALQDSPALLGSAPVPPVLCDSAVHRPYGHPVKPESCHPDPRYHEQAESWAPVPVVSHEGVRIVSRKHCLDGATRPKSAK